MTLAQRTEKILQDPKVLYTFSIKDRTLIIQLPDKKQENDMKSIVTLNDVKAELEKIRAAIKKYGE